MKGDSRETAVIWDDRFFDHDTGPHPESPGRLQLLYEALGSGEVGPVPARLDIRPASLDEIHRVHDPGYVAQLRQFCDAGGGYIWPDTAVSPETFSTALLAAGATLSAVDAVMGKMARNVFALVRPPGHHAERARAMGFCFFNNVAVAARHLQSEYGLGRILILDWDVHHGNGTERSFLTEDSVLYLSVHQSPCYPGTGPIGEVGQADGAGFNVNVPLPPGCGDEAYKAVFRDVFVPIAREYQPEFVLVSAGMDAHALDPLANMRVSDEGFGYMARMAANIARESAGGRLVLSLEGGYHPEAMLSSFRAVVSSLALTDRGDDDEGTGRDPPEHVSGVLADVAAVHRPHWSLS